MCDVCVSGGGRDGEREGEREACVLATIVVSLRAFSKRYVYPQPSYLTFRHAIKEGPDAKPGKQLILGGET